MSTTLDIANLEAVESPLSRSQLGELWRTLLEDPQLADFVGKFDLDSWGRIALSPVSTEHGGIAGRLAQLLALHLPSGRVLIEIGVQVAGRIIAPDVAWCSEEFWRTRRNETPLELAPELCVEVASRSNTIHDLRQKAQAYVDAGAIEAWIVFPKSRRMEIVDKNGARTSTALAVDLSTLFE